MVMDFLLWMLYTGTRKRVYAVHKGKPCIFVVRSMLDPNGELYEETSKLARALGALAVPRVIAIDIFWGDYSFGFDIPCDMVITRVAVYERDIYSFPQEQVDELVMMCPDDYIVVPTPYGIHGYCVRLAAYVIHKRQLFSTCDNIARTLNYHGIRRVLRRERVDTRELEELLAQLKQ